MEADNIHVFQLQSGQGGGICFISERCREEWVKKYGYLYNYLGTFADFYCTIMKQLVETGEADYSYLE